MFRLMLLKMWHKKWMNLCLILGSILLVATVVSFPLYQSAAYDRMLHEEYSKYITEKGKWPGTLAFENSARKDPGGKTITKIENYIGNLSQTLNVSDKQTVKYFAHIPNTGKSTMNRSNASDISIRLAAMSDLENHAYLRTGEMYSELGRTEDGAIEVVMTENGLVNKGLIVGETIQFDKLKDAGGNPIKLYIKGVIDRDENTDFYWQNKISAFYDVAFMNYELFREMFLGENAEKFNLNCYYYYQYEYEDMSADNVDYLLATSEYIVNDSAYKQVIDEIYYTDILKEYIEKRNRISATLMILQIPVLVMLAAFLFMISGQMYEMEKNEISVIKSRGSSSGQIFRLYLYQGFLITLVGAVLGMPLGALFSRVLGATKNFLEFDSTRYLDVKYTKESFIYALVSMAVILLSITLPAIKHSKVSIVNLKQSKAAKKKPLWEKLYIDIILIGVALYGYYNFNKNMKAMAADVLTGAKLDPLLYISSSVFIVGLGLFFLRIQPWIVRLIYVIGKRKWGPASYVSFMENIKNGRKQQLIMLFLIMTISLGMYHATVARTILDNAIANTEYIAGVDLELKEVWTYVSASESGGTDGYIEPDSSKYNNMTFAKSYTKVYKADGYFSTGKERPVVRIMGINTKQFGEMTMISKELLGQHYYTYLNELAVQPEGILCSSNFRDKYGYRIGDSITYNRGDKHITGKIIDFIDYFPQYMPTVTEVNPDGTVGTAENSLIIGHFETMRKEWGIYPYEIWVDLKEGTTENEIYSFIEDNNIRLHTYSYMGKAIEDTKNDPLLQGTNGVLTMGFVVTIILCAVGYLIYWIMSIRERELVFGVLRACGFHKKEIVNVILNEQIFSGLFSVFAGIGIGKLTSSMFVPILERAYASKNQVLPMKLITDATDMYRLYGVIGLVMLVSLTVLIILLFKMNVTKALKLGEE